METLFAHTYLLLFGKLAVGGLVSLAVPTFHELERGFYKSSAAIFLGAGFAIAGGDLYLLFAGADQAVVSPVAVAAWCLFCALFAAYFATLFVEYPFLRARLFPAAVAAGLLALVLTGWAYAPAHGTWVTGLPYALAPLAGAAALGGASAGMLLGHWYLIDRDLDLAPLLRMHAFCRATLRIEIGVVVAGALVLFALSGEPTSPGFAAAFGSDQGMLTLGRAATWAMGLLLLVLIGKTLEIPQTMAATGLFYIQATTVAVGQIIAHWLLFRTGLPL